MSVRYDAVVVGGGHNGLVASAYLAQAGFKVLVVERNERVGGAAATTGLGPGFRVPALAHTVGRFAAGVAANLGLYSHGLHLIEPEVRAFVPASDAGPLTLWGDPARTAQGLAATSPADADAWTRFDLLIRRLAVPLGVLADTTPPDLTTPGAGDLFNGLRLLRKIRGLGPADMRTLMRTAPMPVSDFVREHLSIPHLVGMICLRGVLFGAVGPHSAGTTANLLVDSAGNDGGAAGQTVFARGGPGALAAALESAARAAGTEIRTSAEVVRITSAAGRATGVVLASGEEIGARAVVSGANAKLTLLDLVDPVELGPTLGWRAGNIRVPGVVAKVNLALDGLPAFAGAAGDPQLLRGRIVMAGGIDSVERAFDATKYGGVSDEPPLEVTIPTLVDPALAPDGKHVLSAVVQYAPYALRDGDWDAYRDAFGDLVLKNLERYAPGITDLVLEREVVTPLDLERDYGLTGGHPMHAEMALDQFFSWRPLLGFSRYRLVPRGLYLCSSGAHPGGGITGRPGANAAREVIHDLRYGDIP